MTLPPTSPPPYYSPQQPPVDNSALDVLGIFYYILAVLYLLVGFVPCIYVLLGIFVGAAGTTGADNVQGAQAAATVGGFLVCVGLFLAALFWIFSFLYFLTGSSLRGRKRLTLCYVMAALVCLVFPLGTILGVLTFVSLTKPGVKATFL